MDLDRGWQIGGLFWSANFPPPLLSKSELSMCRPLCEMGGGVDDMHCYAGHRRGVLKPGNS